VITIELKPPKPNPHSHTARPSPIRALVIPISFFPPHPSFTIIGHPNAISELSTTNSGYSAILRIGSNVELLANGLPIRLSNVIMSVHPQHISTNALVLSFRLHNEDLTSQIVDIDISNDIFFDGTYYASVASIGSDDGFMITSIDYAMTWRC
jgi:hypothetical protein